MDMTIKIGIICATDRELAPFLELLRDCVPTEKAMLSFYEGTIHGEPVVLVYSGVCKVNAAIAAQILIDTFDVKTVINAGVAGGIEPELEIFDTVISTEVAYHDVAPDILTEYHPWMKSEFFEADKYLIELSRRAVERYCPNNSIYWGRMVTGEAFIADGGRQEIIDRFEPLTVDMETASIAHVCYVNEIPFLAVRCVTDTAEHSGSGNFEQNCEKASALAAEATAALLKLLNILRRGLL